MHGKSGRCNTDPREIGHFTEGYRRNRRLVWQVGIDLQYEEEQAKSQENILLPRMDMEDKDKDGCRRKRTQYSFAKGYKTVVKLGKEISSGQDKGFRLTRWLHKCNSVRTQRCFTSDEQTLQDTQCSSQENRMDWDYDTQSLNNEPTSILEGLTEEDGGETLGFFLQTRRNIDDRGFSSSLWCRSTNRKLSSPLPPDIRPNILHSIFQFQGDAGNSSGFQQFPSPLHQIQSLKHSYKIGQLDSRFRPQSLDNVSKPPLSPLEDLDDLQRMEHSTEGSSSSGNEEHNSRHLIKISAGRRLRDHKRCSCKSGTST